MRSAFTNHFPASRSFSLFHALVGLDSAATDQAQPVLRFPIDVKETDISYVVHANLPGVTKQNIHIEVDGANVKISTSASDTNAQDPAPKDPQTLIRRERVSGQFERQFNLAQDIDAEQVVAKLSLGVLELTLPKKVSGSSKKISVQ